MLLVSHNSNQSQYNSLRNYKNLAKTLSPCDISVLGRLFKMNSYYEVINISQIRIAKELGIHPVTVCRSIARLVRYKFISKSVAKFKETCTYYLNPIFCNPKFVSILSEVLTCLKKTFSLSTFLHFKQKFSNANLTISSLSNNILPVVSNTKICKYTGRAGEDFFKKFPKRKENEAMDGIEVSPELREVTKALNLTKWGQLKLSVFPDHILKYVLNELRLSKEAQNNFGWFISVAIKSCDREKIRPNWKQYDFLKKKYQQPDNAKMVLPKKESGNRNSVSSDIVTVKKVEVSIAERIKQLEVDLQGWKARLLNPNPYDFDSPRKQVECITLEIEQLRKIENVK